MGAQGAAPRVGGALRAALDSIALNGSALVLVTPIVGATPASLARAASVLKLHLSRAELGAAAVARSDLRASLERVPGPLGERLRGFVDTLLGDARVSPEDAAQAFERGLAELRRLGALAAPLRTVSDACARIEAAGAPAWAATS